MINWPIEIKLDKYTKWYEQLVKQCKERTLPKEVYTEKHHIIPFCITEDNSPENLVEFTAREHYVAHLLLWRMTMPAKWHNKMTMALHIMVNGSGNGRQKLERSQYIINSRLFEKYRKEWRDHLSEVMKGENNPFYGKTHSEETKALLVLRNAQNKHIRSEKLKGENNGMYGQSHTEEVKQQISEKCKEIWTDDLKQQQSERVKQQWQDPEWAENQRIKKLARWANMTEEERSAIGQKAAATKKANGFKMSEESKKKMSESRKKAISEGKIVPWNKGKKVGVFSDPEARKAGSKKAVATKRANGTMPDFKGEKNPFYGRKHSEETKAKIRATKAAKKAANNFDDLFDQDNG